MKIGVMLRHIANERGGIGRFTISLLERLLAKDRRNRYVFLYKDDAPVGRYAGFENVEEVALASRHDLFWDQVAVPRFAASHGLDLVFNPKLSIPLRSPCPSILALHGADWFVVPESYPLHYRLYHKLGARTYTRRAAAVVVASEDAARRIRDRLPSARHKTVAIHHGVSEAFRRVSDQGALQAVKQKYELPERFILFVGQIYPMKNLPRILQAFAKLKDGLPHGLVIVGSRSWRADHELQGIKALKLEDRVKLTGFVPDDDLPALYSLADVSLFPSLYEGFGIPLAEAMACGCPVVTSNRGACPEVVGDAALVVDPLNVDAIAAATRRVLTEETLAPTLVERGLARAPQFTWDRAAEQMLALFDRVAAKPSSAGEPDRLSASAGTPTIPK